MSAPDRIWLFPQPLDRDGGNWTRTEIEGQPQYIRADLVQQQAVIRNKVLDEVVELLVNADSPPWADAGQWSNAFAHAAIRVSGLKFLPSIQSRSVKEVQNEAYERAAVIADQWATVTQRQHGKGGPAAAIRALKSDDASGLTPPEVTTPSPGQVASSVAPAAIQDEAVNRLVEAVKQAADELDWAYGNPHDDERPHAASEYLRKALAALEGRE